MKGVFKVFELKFVCFKEINNKLFEFCEFFVWSTVARNGEFFVELGFELVDCFKSFVGKSFFLLPKSDFKGVKSVLNRVVYFFESGHLFCFHKHQLDFFVSIQKFLYLMVQLFEFKIEIFVEYVKSLSHFFPYFVFVFVLCLFEGLNSF